MPTRKYLLSVLLTLLMILPAFAGVYPRLDGQIASPMPLSQPPVAPTFSEPQVSSTVVNQITNFSLLWSDPGKMSGYIFSYNTGSGFVNDSFVPLENQTTAWTNTTMPLYVSVGDRIQWMYYMEDSAGNWWKSYTYAFVAAQQPSSVSFAYLRLITDNSYDLLAYDGVNFANLGNFPQFVGTYGSATGFENVVWNPQATLAIAVGYNDSAVLFTRSTDSVIALYPGAPSDTNLVGVAWTPNGTSAVITGTSPDVILVYSSEYGNFTRVPNPTGITGLGTVAWNPASNYAIIAGSNGLIRYSGTGSLNIVPSAAGISFTGIGFNPNGTMALLGTASGSLYKYATATSNLSLVTTIPGASQLRQITFSRDGAYALMIGQSGSMYKYDGRSVYQIASNSSTNGLSFSPDDSYAMAVTSGGGLLTENYDSNSTSLATIANNTKLLGIDFLPPYVMINMQNTSSTTPLGQISMKVTPGSYNIGTPISFSGRTLMSNGTIVPSQTIYIWINGRNQGSVTSNQSGYWTFSITPTSNGIYYAAASQNNDGSGVTSQQLALTVSSATTTSTVTTSVTTTHTSNSSSSATTTSSGTSTTSSTNGTTSSSSTSQTTNSTTTITSTTSSPTTTTSTTTSSSNLTQSVTTNSSTTTTTKTSSNTTSGTMTSSTTTITTSTTSSPTTTTSSTTTSSSSTQPVTTSTGTSATSSSTTSTETSTQSTSSSSTTSGTATTSSSSSSTNNTSSQTIFMTSTSSQTTVMNSSTTYQESSKPASLASYFDSIPYVTTNSPTLLGTLIFAIEVGLVIGAPLAIRKIVKKSKDGDGDDSHGWRW